MTEPKEYEPEFVYPYGFRSEEDWERLQKDLEKAKKELDDLTVRHRRIRTHSAPRMFMGNFIIDEPGFYRLGFIEGESCIKYCDEDECLKKEEWMLEEIMFVGRTRHELENKHGVL